MANDNQTALGMSIQRKKDKIKELEFEQRALRNFSEVPIMQNSVSDRIKLLNELITEDEKLLAVEKEQLIAAADALEAENVRKANIIFKRFGVESLCTSDQNAGLNYYNQKYGTDGK